MRLTLGKVVLVVEPEADAVHHPAATPCTLLRRRLGDLLDLQLLDLVARRVALDPRQAGIDHIADARDGQRGLGDVGRQHHAAPLRRREHPGLVLCRLAREQGEDFGAGQMLCLAQRLGSLADLALAGQEHQHVTRPTALRLIDRIDDRIEQVAPLALARWRALARTRRRLRPFLRIFVLHRAVMHGDRIQAARHLDHRRRLACGVGKVAGKAVGIERRRGHDHLEIGPFGQQRAQIAEQEVDVQAALVRLVDDQGVIGGEQRVGLSLSQQNAVGHQLDMAGCGELVGEADLVAHRLPERTVELLRDARSRGPRRQPPRLGVTDQTRCTAPQRHADLGQLSGLARTRFATDDDDLMRSQRFGNLVAPRRNRQLGRKLRLGQRRLACQQSGTRARKKGIEAILQFLLAFIVASTKIPRHALQAGTVDAEAIVENRCRHKCRRTGVCTHLNS